MREISTMFISQTKPYKDSFHFNVQILFHLQGEKGTKGDTGSMGLPVSDYNTVSIHHTS